MSVNKDWGWALLIGGLAAASPHTGSARLIPSLIGGALVAGIIWAVRRHRFDERLPSFLRATGEERSAGEEPLPLSIDVPSALCLLGAALVAAPALIWLWQQYTISIWRNGHGLFLPVVIFVLVRASLRSARPPFGSDPWLALPFLAIAVALSWLAANTGLGQLGAVGLMTLAPGLALLLIGREATRCIAFPLALLVFLMPLPEGLTDPLGLASATAVVFEPVIQAIGVDGMRVQTLYVMPDSIFGIAANCSGASTFYAGLLVAIVLSRNMSPAARVLLPLAVWPITVAINAIRLTLLVAGGARWGTGFIHSPFHGLSGIATFWGVLAAIALAFFAVHLAAGRRVEESAT